MVPAPPAIRLSNDVRVQRLSDDTLAAWNRFAPAVVLIPESLWDRLCLADEGPLGLGGIDDETLTNLQGRGILAEAGHDTWPARFDGDVRRALENLDRESATFLANRDPYSSLHITNQACNLGCPYCVSRYARQQESALGRVERDESRWSAIVQILDQFLERKRVDSANATLIDFNGGEFLLEWDLLKRIVSHAESHYPDVPIHYAMNSNMTLMDAEKAEFLAGHGFRVYASIDGYQRLHDKSRVHGNGCGSFREVIRGIRTYNAHRPPTPVGGFQGTIDDIRSFDVEALFRMARFGFREARLSPNLLGITEEEAGRRADFVTRLFERGLNRKLAYVDVYFGSAKTVMNLDPYSFFFPCIGLSATPTRGLTVNVDALTVSHLCGFASNGAVPWSEMQGDIYHPAAWRAARAFIRKRYETLRTDCRECDVVGVCRTGCVLTGLDSANQINEAACTYQRKMWRNTLELAFRRVQGGRPRRVVGDSRRSVVERESAH